MKARNKNQLLKIIQNKGGINRINPNSKIIIPSDDSRVADKEVPILSRLIELKEPAYAVKLIQRGADVNTEDFKGKLPIDYAITSQYSTVIVELIKKGANANYIMGRDNVKEDVYDGEACTLFDPQNFSIPEGIVNMITLEPVKFAQRLIDLIEYQYSESEDEAREILLNIWSEYNNRDKKDITTIINEVRIKQEQEEWDNQQELEAKSSSNVQYNVSEEEINLLTGEVSKSNITDLNPNQD